MAQVVLLTGSNQGVREELLGKARERIGEQIGRIVNASGVYESEPWGFSAEGNFLNQALVVETALEPIRVLDEVQAIERELGRVRTEAAGPGKRNYASRPIDIDILFYDDRVTRCDRLTIPHPLIAEREFVLVPLREILPDYIHPVYCKAIREL